jgi:hypothetical protein
MRCKKLHTLEVGGAGVTNTFLEAVCDRGEHDVYADWKVRFEVTTGCIVGYYL